VEEGGLRVVRLPLAGPRPRFRKLNNYLYRQSFQQLCRIQTFVPTSVRGELISLEVKDIKLDFSQTYKEVEGAVKSNEGGQLGVTIPDMNGMTFGFKEPLRRVLNPLDESWVIRGVARQCRLGVNDVCTSG